MENSMNFFFKAMQSSKSRILHGSNGLPNKANEKSSKELLSYLNTGKTACQIVWEDGLRAGTKNSLPGSNLRGDPLFPF